MILGITKTDTTHGPRNITLHKNTIVKLTPATNLPDDSEIKYWASQIPNHPLPRFFDSMQRNEGIGLHSTDVDIARMNTYTIDNQFINTITVGIIFDQHTTELKICGVADIKGGNDDQKYFNTVDELSQWLDFLTIESEKAKSICEALCNRMYKFTVKSR